MVNPEERAPIDTRRAELLSRLAPIGPLRVDAVAAPGTAEMFRITRPADFDRLLDAAAGDPEQNLPYWAELWPSGIALASAILRQPEQVRGQRVLELGCGLGVTAIAALRAGADLLITDYSAEALALSALNALNEAGVEPEVLRLNWREPSQELLHSAGSGFPIVLAADVLYEARDVEPLLDLAPRLVAQAGELWLAEPGRPPAARFIDVMRERGWQITSERYPGPWPDPEDNRKGVVVGMHRLTRVMGDGAVGATQASPGPLCREGPCRHRGGQA
ncbi:MAG: methyltransferase [Thermomicrobiales bacterium]|nr:methyltransferase [Thermomicrobiales bacterium]